ncbi:MAG: ParB/RepB/Spo0J family partition protein (plasmid) [Leptolyngbya sp. BL-A-14]
MSPAKKPAPRQLKNVSLFHEEDEPTSSSQAVNLSQIKLPKQQPRKYFDPQKITQLAESIKEHGILEPLLVRPVSDGNYELIAGERRLRAAKDAGLTEVPIVIRDFNDKQALQVSLIENLQREDLNPVEETEGLLQLLAVELDKPQSDVVSLLHRMLDESKGKVPHNVMGNSETTVIQQIFNEIASMEWQSFVSNRLPLLNLQEDVLEALRQGKLEYTKARAIARIKDDSQRRTLLKDTISKDLSLSQIKERIATLKAVGEEEKPVTVKQQFDSAYQQMKKSKVWDDPKKQKKLEKLLADLQALIEI